MPNRVLHESIRGSHTIDALSPMAECMFYRLTTVADHYGRFDADPRMLKSTCFPLKDMPAKDVESWRDEMTRLPADAAPDDKPLITLYKVNGRAYGYFTKWAECQRDRASDKNPPKPKFPDPAEAETIPPTPAPSAQPSPAVEPNGPTKAPALPQVESEQAPQPKALPKQKVVPTPEAEARFEEFWKLYPGRNEKKLGKAVTRKLFLDLSDEDQALCLKAVREYAKLCRDTERLPKDPQRFLKGKDGEFWRELIPQPKAPVEMRKPVSASAPPQPAEPPPPEAIAALRRLVPGFGSAFEGKA